MQETDGSRLKKWRTNKGLTQRDLASKLGRSQGFVGNIEAGTTGLSRDLIARLAENTTANIAWLLTGIGPMDRDTDDPGFAAGHTNARIEPPDYARPMTGDFAVGGEEFTMVRRFDIDVSAGRGIIPVEGEQVDHLAFSRTWLSRHGISADLSGLVRVKGDSMAPTIPDQAHILVDFRGKADWSAPGVYVIRYEGAIVVKRLQIIDGGTGKLVVLLSDNSLYQPIIVASDSAIDFQPIARVRAVLSVLP